MQSAAQKPLVRAEPQELPAVGVVYWMPMRWPQVLPAAYRPGMGAFSPVSTW